MSARKLLQRLARNALGVVFIAVGIALWLMPIVPGGALALIGLLLIDFPGKQRLVRWLWGTKLFVKLVRRNPRLARVWRRLTAQIDP
jgi:hypothetical protein